MAGKIASRLRKADIWLIVCVFVYAVVLIIGAWIEDTGSKAAAAQIYQNGRLVREVPLNKSIEFQIIGDYVNTVTVLDGKISVTASDCPGGDCIHMGQIHAAGRSIVCLPNKVEIRVVGEPEVDAVIG